MKYLIYFLSPLLLTACPLTKGYKYNSGELTEIPQNLEEYNTEYNDYNSTAPSLGSFYALAFSTDRNHPDQYDIQIFPMSIVFSKSTGELTIKNETYPYNYAAEDFWKLKHGLFHVNTIGNELGPYIFNPERRIHYRADFQMLIMYASDKNGDFNIRYMYATDSTDMEETLPVSFLNSDNDDLYPSINMFETHIYFCSNRKNSDFDIYQASLNRADESLISKLSDTTDVSIINVEKLNSISDDKCPFVFENYMVFASDRDGGYGEFDLYYSEQIGNEWTTPKNMGEKVNTSSNEYRPILIDEGVDPARIMMIFSSDRPGGKGGYDLYWVGADL